MRRALFWSLVAHFFVLWLMINERAAETDSTTTGLAVTLATRPSKTTVVAPAATAAMPKVVPSAMVNDDAAVPSIRKQRAAETVSTTTPVAEMEIAPATISTGAPDADGLRRYRFALAHELRRAWVYPRQALLQKWEGTTEIRIELFASGRFAAARIEKSSGHQVLDDAALKLISDAAIAAPVPRGLVGAALTIVQPVVFSLPE
jgi:protein TonB